MVDYMIVETIASTVISVFGQLLHEISDPEHRRGGPGMFLTAVKLIVPQGQTQAITTFDPACEDLTGLVDVVVAERIAVLVTEVTWPSAFTANTGTAMLVPYVVAVTPDVACDSVRVLADTTALIGAVFDTLLITRFPASNTASNLALALPEIPPLRINAPVLLLVAAVVLLIVIALVVVAPRAVTVARVSASAGNAIAVLETEVM
jgi:hypothetical protein